jgi:hypothetical protein
MAVFVAGVAVLMGVGAAYFFSWIPGYYTTGTAERVSALQLTELMTNATDSHDRPAVDIKTGDLYFPEAHLYLPVAALRDAENTPLKRLVYSPQTDGVDAVLSFSSASLQSTIKGRMLSAPTSDGAWDIVPKLQACSRGVTVLFNKDSDWVDKSANELKSTVTLQNGKTAYVYLDKGCREMTTTAEALKDLRSY